MDDLLTDGTLTFIGTATTLLRLGSFTLLTDPNFLRKGQRAYLGKGLWSTRLTDPSLSVEQVPAVDAVVLSHLHGDHFDRVARRGLPRTAPVLTTPAAERRLTSWGFEAHSLPTWASHTLAHGEERLTVLALPGVHGRGLIKPLLPPVMGSLLHYQAPGAERRVYVTGDTLTGEHLQDIRRRCEPVDTVVAHLGGTRVLLHTVTMDASAGVQLLQAIPAPRVIPVHYDDYRVFRSPVADFVRRLAASGLPTQAVVPQRGETVALW